jgi:hypothetical protein
MSTFIIFALSITAILWTVRLLANLIIIYKLEKWLKDVEGK